MNIRSSARATILLLAGCVALSACTGQNTNQPTPPTTQPTVSAATELPAPTSAPAATATSAPAATTEPTAAPTSEPTPLPGLVPTQATGQVMLTLAAGTGDDQVGVTQDVHGPSTFRIGADGSVRILDTQKKRVLFFDLSGKLNRTAQISQAQDPQDFTVNNAGDVFVLDRAGAQVLRYSIKGDLAATYPVDPSISTRADSIMLTSAQDLVLVEQNANFWMLLTKNKPIAPEQQAATMREGVVTPRSPVAFQVVASSDEPALAGLELRSINQVDTPESDQVTFALQAQLPTDVQFFNIDRAMNVYFTRTASDGSSFDFWRVLPDGSVAGGARIATNGCGSSLRSRYIDQVGAAWTMCVQADQIQIMRYALIGLDGVALPDADKNAASVLWRPGARLDAA